MKKKQTNNYSFWLILIAISVITYLSIIITVHQNDINNKKLELEVERTTTDNTVYYPPNDEIHETRESQSVFYRLTSDKRYHYQFRFEFNPSTKNDDHRLMIILNGATRSCSDMWDFSVGIRILKALHDHGYSILVICSRRKTFDVDIPIEENNDVKYIYLSLQRWINEEYYTRFQHYPLLYIHATSRGSKFAGILCRVLPIQAQTLYIFIGHREATLTPSAYDTDLQTRLSLDPTFANWFYFDFCYNKTAETSEDRKLCPFQNDQNYYYPVPPSFFTFLKNDPYQFEGFYTNFIREISKKSLQLGGPLLTRSETLQLDTLLPSEPTPSFMQENFHIWRHKPHASRLFFEHITNPEKYGTTDPLRKTCWCLDVDLKYFETFPNITMTWTRRKQYEYSDYVKDIRKNLDGFSEVVCGDLLATHAIVSRNINKSLEWMKEMDQLRRSLYLDDYLKRPLRIWMYNKKSLIKPSFQFFAHPQWIDVSKEYLMYSPEYFIQDYFRRLKIPGEVHDQNFQWAVNPLLADYFIIPSDSMYFYFYHQPTTLNSKEFDQLIFDLNENYFNTLLTNIRTNYPYWSLASSTTQIGANHILAIPGGRNMGVLSKKIQNILKNVIQVAFTGVREDLISSNLYGPYAYRGLNVTYRHHYDVIVPQFTPLNTNRTKSDDIDSLVQNKNCLFYFAGALAHATSVRAARSQLSLLMQDMKEKQITNMTMEIQNKTYHAITIIDGHIETSEYIKSIQSVIFSLCPEGFLPWSPRIYESIQIGAIPVILADNIVLPFERFINWRSLSAKINVSNIPNITNIADRIQNLEEYTKEKLKSALPYLNAFQWPYIIVTEERHGKRIFQPQNDKDEGVNNVFYYLWLELRCRRLEQWYGFTVNTTTEKSLEAQRLACTNHPTICPCHNETNSLAFQEYL
jgi:hypothetical protein